MSIPFVRDLIPRAALVEAISSAVKSHRLIIVQGPAGYGKTSVAALVVASAAIPTAWYTAQPWHGGGFVDYLIAELRSVREDFGRRTLAIAAHGRPATDDAGELRLWASRVGASCAQELGHIQERLVVVVEDYQVLEGDLSFCDVIAGAMHQLPETVSIVLLGRSTPTLPLAEWIAQGRAVQFSAEDLKFNPMETMLLAQKHGVDLDEQRARELCAQCEGWPVGISLLVGARTTTASPHELSEVPLASSLLERHLSSLPADLMEFLELTAVLEVIDVAILEQFGGMPTARRMVKELERRGEMLTVLRTGTSYRLHRLMREAIVDRVRDRAGDAAVARLHAGVGTMLEAAGRLAPALFHLERSRDEAHLVRFLMTNVDALFADGHGEQAAKVVRELAKSGSEQPVLIGRVQGMLLRQRGLPGARELFVTALERARENNDHESIFSLRTLLLWDALDDLDPTALPAVVSFALEAESLGNRQRTTALILLGWVKAIEGDFVSAIEKAAAAAELGAAYPELRFRAALLYAYAATCRGDFVHADETMSTLLRDLESSEHIVLLCYTLFWYARLSLWWGDIGPAADYARQGTTLGRHLNLHAELASVFDVLAEISASAGDRPGCMQAIEIVNEHAAAAWYSGDRERLAAHAQQTLARCEFVGGSASRAAGIVRAALDHTAPPPAVRASMMADEALYTTLMENSGASAILGAAGRELTSVVPFDIADACALASASALLGLVHAVAPVADVQSLDELPVANNYRGFIASRSDLHDLHRLRAALHRLATGESSNVADDVAELTAGYERLKHRGSGFEAAAVSALLQIVARRRAEVSFAMGAAQILFVRAAEDASLRKAAPRGAALTERETEVLSLVALGLTNKEIAQRLGLGRRTVETHVEHVLGKFNAASRTRAVAEAIRAGLLPASSWGGSEDASLA